MQRERNKSKKEIKEQQDHFLSFKDKMQFKQVQNFSDFYSMKGNVGKGAFGAVMIGKHRATSMPCAIKVIKKRDLRAMAVYEELNKNEFEILEITQHPHITRIFELMEDKHNYFIVMELVSGGNLL